MAIAVLPVTGLCLETLGLVLHIVGLATPEWSVRDPFSAGLWEFCLSGSCGEPIPTIKTDELKAAKAFSIIGMLMAVVAVAAACLHVLLPILGRQVNVPFRLVSLGVAILASACIFTCVICWGASVHRDLEKNLGFSLDLGYSFGLSIAGGILLLLGGIIVRCSNRPMYESIP